MTLTVRSATVTGATTKGSALTHAELDENFDHLSQSSGVSFTQSGSGATSRTVQAKLRDVISAKDFGATGDGSTNDAAAIQAALDLAAISGTKATVHLPQGVYALGTTTLSIPANVTLAGESTESTFINYTGTGTGIDIAAVSEWGLRDFRLGLGTSATITAIKVRTTAGNSVLRGRADRIEIVGSSGIVAGQIGIHAVASGADILSECWFTNITLIEVDKPIIRESTEGNFWLGINISEFGDTNSAIAIDSSCNSEFLQARVAGSTGAGTNLVAYKQTANNNIDDLVVDIQGGGNTALNVTGTKNAIRITRPEGTTPIGTYASTNLVLDATGEVAAVPGVKFPATQSSSSDVNTLDDYEEGTFTPTWTSSGDAPAIGDGTLAGYYTKIGRKVSVIINMTAGGTTTFGTGAWKFALPFTAATVTNSKAGGGSLRCLNSGVAYYVGVGDVLSNTATTGNLVTNDGDISASVPFAWASADAIDIYIEYITAT